MKLFNKRFYNISIINYLIKIYLDLYNKINSSLSLSINFYIN